MNVGHAERQTLADFERAAADVVVDDNKHFRQAKTLPLPVQAGSTSNWMLKKVA